MVEQGAEPTAEQTAEHGATSLLESYNAFLA